MKGLDAGGASVSASDARREGWGVGRGYGPLLHPVPLHHCPVPYVRSDDPFRNYIPVRYKSTLYHYTVLRPSVTLFRYSVPLLYTATPDHNSVQFLYNVGLCCYSAPLLYTMALHRHPSPLLETVTPRPCSLLLLSTVTQNRYFEPSLYKPTRYHSALCTVTLYPSICPAA